MVDGLFSPKSLLLRIGTFQEKSLGPKATTYSVTRFGSFGSVPFSGLYEVLCVVRRVEPTFTLSLAIKHNQHRIKITKQNNTSMYIAHIQFHVNVLILLSLSKSYISLMYSTFTLFVITLFYFESSFYEYKTGEGTSGLIPNIVHLSEMISMSQAALCMGGDRKGRGGVTSETSAPLVSTSLVSTGLALRELLRAAKSTNQRSTGCVCS